MTMNVAWYCPPVLLLVSACSASVDARNQDDLLKNCSSNFHGLVPSKWLVLSKAKGDLNGDGLEDMAFVAESPGTKNPSENGGKTRRLTIATFSSGAKKYCVAYSDDKFMPHRASQFVEEPFDRNGIQIDRGSLLVSLNVFFSAGSWETKSISYRFRLRHGGLRLIGYDSITALRSTGDIRSISANFLTGEIDVTGDDSTQDELRKRCPQLATKEVLIDSISDALDFDVIDSTCLH